MNYAMGSICAIVYFKYVELTYERWMTEDMEKMSNFSSVMQEIFIRGFYMDAYIYFVFL